jgi:hypothetical protein
VIRLERHTLGPRVFVLGLRIHEVGLGLGVLAVSVAGCIAEVWGMTHRVEAAAGVGSWLVIKDWRDLFRSKRNTAAWSPIWHRVPRN